jgi:hypothetical protein
MHRDVRLRRTGSATHADQRDVRLRKHWSNARGQVIMIGEQSLDTPVERTNPRRARLQTEGLEHVPNMIREARRHFDELRSCANQRNVSTTLIRRATALSLYSVTAATGLWAYA